jgi:hypothetical protein
LGDINLDGRVDMTDATIFAPNCFAGSANSKYWPSGDFDYNAVITINDLYLMARNWGEGVPLSENLPPAPIALASLGLPAAPEPELMCPMALSLLGCALLRRTRGRPSRIRPDARTRQDLTVASASASPCYND